jgi:hypothetical protein
MNARDNLAYLPQKEQQGECLLIGPENLLIPEGVYQATYLHHETCGMYGKRLKDNKSKLADGKVYLWFWIDPYSEKLSPGEKVELYMPYNASAILHPIGKGGKFEMSRKKNYYKDYRRLFGVSRDDRISPGAFKNKVFSVRVGAVETNERQKKHTADSRYSVIRELMGIDS